MSIPTRESFESALSYRVHAELTKAAEPLVVKAIADIESALRRRLAEMLVGSLETSYDMERDGQILIVKVRLAPSAGIRRE